MNALTTLPRVSSGDGHDRRVGDRRMLDEAVLDLGRADAVAGGLEHVVGAALVPEVAVVVARGDVAGAAPVAGVLAARAFGIAEVLEEEHRVGRAVGRDAGGPRPRRARRAASSLPSSSITAMRWPGIGAAHRARLRRPQRVRVADDVVHLGLAEHLVDRDAERVARPLEHRRADRFAGAHDRCAGSMSNASRGRGYAFIISLSAVGNRNVLRTW